MTKIVNKANARLGFLRRNLHIKQQHIKEMAYKCLVKPLVEYACAVWSPSTDCLKSQQKAARFLTNNYHQRASVTKMLQQLNWESLEARRQASTLSLFTKGVQGEVDTDAEARLKKSTWSTRGNSTKYIQPQSNTIMHTKTFWPLAIPLLNQQRS